MKRIEKIKNRLFDKDFMTKKEWWGENQTILTDENIKKKPIMVRKALAVMHVAKNMPIEIKEDELIVGVPTMASVGFGKCFPDYALPEEKEEAAKSSYTEKSVFGHHPANYEKLLRLGLKGIRDEIYYNIEQKQESEMTEETYDFYSSVLISLDAVNILAHRYSVLLMEEAKKCEEPNRKKELIEMSKICTRVPENPPSSFHEALQSIWITFVLFHSTMEFLPIGRSDQYLYPYLKKDLEAGIISIEYADELVGSWLAKFGERVQLDPQQWEMHLTEQDTQYNGADPTKLEGSADAAGYANDEGYNYGTSANHWLINMILGGQTREGEDATIAQGAKCYLGGNRFNKTFFEPTILTDVTADMDVAKDMEIFGPVVPVIVFDDIDEAVAIANQTKYGLSGGVIGRDVKTAMSTALRLESGTTVVNGCGDYRTLHTPFGGHKMSGIGTEGLLLTLEEMMLTKCVAIKDIVF